MINHFHFLRPGWFILLPLLAILLWLYNRRQAVSRSWRAVCDPLLLPHLLVGGSEGSKNRWSLSLMAISGGLALVALAGPAWKQLEQPVFRDQSALVLVLDLSRSMDATDIAPSRLTRARHKMIDILKKREEGQTALVIYAADAFVVSPLTQDANTIISQVSALETTLLPRQGSRPDLALKKAAQLLKQSGVPKGHILMVTDGLENVPKARVEEALTSLRKQGAVVSLLGVGSSEGAPIKLAQGGFLRDKNEDIVISKLDESALIALARQGGGYYHRLSLDDRDIRRFFEASSVREFEEQGETAGLKADRWREEGPWLLLLILPFSALVFRRGHLVSIVFIFSSSLALTLLSFPQAADALDWEGLWSRQDQKAARIFAQGNEGAAAELFVNPEWKAAAHYRAEQYQESIKALDGIQTPDALYNKGNALARLGKLPEAIQAYDEALNLDPKHEDAEYNKAQLLKQMEMHNQEQENKPEGEPSEDQKGDSEQTGEGESGENQAGEQSQGPQKNQRASSKDQSEDKGDKEEAAREQNTREAGSRNDPENQEAQPAEEQNQDQSEGQNGPSQAQLESSEEDESQQAVAQWLRRIPDDPGGLLRRKFLHQSQQQQQTGSEEKSW